jgi:hypothetical protein
LVATLHHLRVVWAVKEVYFISPKHRVYVLGLCCSCQLWVWSSFSKGKKKKEKNTGHTVKWSLKILVNFIIEKFGPKSCFRIVPLLNVGVVNSNL